MALNKIQEKYFKFLIFFKKHIYNSFPNSIQNETIDSPPHPPPPDVCSLVANGSRKYQE